MAKKKVCRTCKIFVEGEACPVCKGASFSTSWQGKINFIDPGRSFIAHEMEVKHKGEYTIKVR